MWHCRRARSSNLSQVIAESQSKHANARRPDPEMAQLRELASKFQTDIQNDFLGSVDFFSLKYIYSGGVKMKMMPKKRLFLLTRIL